MKRRDFLKNSLGIAGFVGLGASSGFIKTAMAEGWVEAGVSESEANFELTLESIADNFKYKGHQVKILRREYRRRGKPLSERVEQWAMTFNGRELPRNHFSRLGIKGCYFSDLLPFNDECTPRSLATALVDGHDLKLFELK